MISPIALSVLFLILTLFIVLGWTRIILGSPNEDEEILNKLRQQISSLTLLSKDDVKKCSVDSIPATSDNEIDDEENKSGKKSCKNESSINKIINSTGSSPSRDVLENKKVSDKIEEQFNNYIKEIDKKIKENSIKNLTSSATSPENNIPIINSNSYITVKVKKSPTFVNYLASKSDQFKNKFSNSDKKNDTNTDGSFISCPSCSNIELTKRRSRSPIKKEYPKHGNNSKNGKLQEINLNYKRSKISTSSSSTSEKSQLKLESRHCHLSKIRRHKSLNTKIKQPNLVIRKSSSEDKCFKKSVKLKPKKKLSYTLKKHLDYDNINSTSSCYCNHEPLPQEKSKDKRRKDNSPYKYRTHKDLEVHEYEDFKSIINNSRLPVRKTEKIMKRTNSAYKIQQKQLFDCNTSACLSDISLDCQSGYPNDFKKLQDEFKYECYKSFDKHIGTNFLSKKIKFPNEDTMNFTSDGKQQRRPSSPKKYNCNTRTLNNLLTNMKGRNCESDSLGMRANSPSKRPRSRSYERVKSTMREIEDSNFCYNSNVYDIGLILMDSPDENMTEILYGADTNPMEKFTKKKKKIIAPLTSDKSIEVKRSRSHDTISHEMKSKSVNTSNICCADSTQTSLPKLAVQHIDSYCEPMEMIQQIADKSNCTDIKIIEDPTKISDLTMPNVNLVDVSKSLRKSRNIIEELVKETKNIVSDQDKTRKKIENAPKSRIPAPKIMVTHRHTPKNTPNSSPQVTPRITPNNTPKVTPVNSPKISPKNTPKVSPISSPKNSPISTPKCSPKITPNNSPQTSSVEISNFINNTQNTDITDNFYTAPVSIIEKKNNFISEIVEQVNIQSKDIKTNEEMDIPNKINYSANTKVHEFTNLHHKQTNENVNPKSHKTQNSTHYESNVTSYKNLIYSEIPRPISPNNKINRNYSPVRHYTDINQINNNLNLVYSEISRPKSPTNRYRNGNTIQNDDGTQSSFSSEIPRPASQNCNQRSYVRNDNDSLRNCCNTDQSRPISPTVTNDSMNRKNYETRRSLSPPYLKQGLIMRQPSPVARIATYSRSPFCADVIRPISPHKPQNFNPRNHSRSPESRTESPTKQKINRNRSQSPCNIPVRTDHRRRSPNKLSISPRWLDNKILKNTRSKSRDFNQINQNESQLQRSQSKSPQRSHDMACSTANFNFNVETQCTHQSHLDPNSRTRWNGNSESKKFQYDYNFPYEKWTSGNSVPNSNFYQVTDICSQTPYLNRSASPLPNPSNMKTENLRRILHAKEIATRINR